MTNRARRDSLRERASFFKDVPFLPMILLFEKRSLSNNPVRITTPRFDTNFVLWPIELLAESVRELKRLKNGATVQLFEYTG